MKMLPNISLFRTGMAAGVVVASCLVVGCGNAPTPAKIAPPTNSPVMARGGSNQTSGIQGTNIAFAETNSIFDDKIKNARDPFFPSRQESKPTADPKTGVPAVPAPPVELALALNGIMGTASQRVALINGRTFEPGDEVVIHTTNGQAKVKCLEIGAQSVTVTVNGKTERRKLFLKK